MVSPRQYLEQPGFKPRATTPCLKSGPGGSHGILEGTFPSCLCLRVNSLWQTVFSEDDQLISHPTCSPYNVTGTVLSLRGGSVE